MAKLSSTAIFEHIDKAPLAPAYLLVGEEGFLIDRALHLLVDRALSGAMREFNLDVFYGKDATVDAVSGQARTLPMMAEHRVVVVKEADRLKDAGRLKDCVSEAGGGAILVLVAEDADRAKEEALAKVIGPSGVQVHFYPPSEGELTGWVRELARQSGYRLEKDAVEHLTEALGDNIALIEAELNKVFNYAGERKTVTYSDVKECVGDFGAPLVFDLANAIAEKQTLKALDILSKLMMEGQQPVVLLGMVAQHWRKLVEAKDMASRGDSDDKIAKTLRVHFRQKRSFLTQVAKLGEDELVSAFGMFRKADAALKGSALSNKTVMERLIFDLAGQGAWRRGGSAEPRAGAHGQVRR